MGKNWFNNISENIGVVLFKFGTRDSNHSKQNESCSLVVMAIYLAQVPFRLKIRFRFNQSEKIKNARSKYGYRPLGTLYLWRHKS